MVIRREEVMNERHLEFLQQIISRLSNHSFLIKGWTVSLLTALYSLAQFEANQSFIVISYYPIIIFWFIDSYYLHLEKIFRDIYSKTVKGEIKSFVIDKNDSEINTFKNYLKCLFSITIWPLYLISILVTSLIIIL